MQAQTITSIPNGLHTVDPVQVLHPATTRVLMQRGSDAHHWQVCLLRAVTDADGRDAEQPGTYPIAASASELDAQVLLSGLECFLTSRGLEDGDYLAVDELGQAHFPDGGVVYFDLGTGTVLGHRPAPESILTTSASVAPLHSLFRLELPPLYAVYAAAARDRLAAGLPIGAFGYWAEGHFWPPIIEVDSPHSLSQQ